MPGRYTELFVLYRRGEPVHIHSDKSVFENWMRVSAWLYPPAECEIIRFVPDAAGMLHEKAGRPDDPLKRMIDFSGE